MKWAIIILALAFTGCAGAKNKPDSNSQTAVAAPATSQVSKSADLNVPEELRKVSCTKGDEARLLEVVKKGDGCALDYTKAGKTAAVASGTHGVRHCVATKKKIRSKLEKAGYSCG
jgi:hypothetical protein